MADTIYPLCVKCINCKIRKNFVSCKMNHFKNKSISFIIMMSAFDFNCSKFEGFEVLVDIEDEVVE